MSSDRSMCRKLDIENLKQQLLKQAEDDSRDSGTNRAHNVEVWRLVW